MVDFIVFSFTRFYFLGLYRVSVSKNKNSTIIFFLLNWYGGGKCGEPLGLSNTYPEFGGFLALRQVLFCST